MAVVASPSRVRSCSATPFISALRCMYSSASDELSMPVTSAAPAMAACTPQPPQ